MSGNEQPADTGAGPGRDRRRRILILWGTGGALVALLALFFVLRGLVRAERLQPAYLTGEALFFLSVLNLLLILVLLTVLVRDLVKLVIEHRRQALGSRFHTRLVLAFIGLTLLPSVFIFFVAFNFLRDSVSQWFNTDLESVLASTERAVDGFLDHEAERCSLLARHSAEELQRGWPPSGGADGGPPSTGWLEAALRSAQARYGLDCLAVYGGGRLLATATGGRVSHEELQPARVEGLLGELLKGRPGSKYERLPQGMLVLGGAPLSPGPGRERPRLIVLAGMYVPERIADPLEEVVTASERYRRARAFKEETVRVYHFTFLLISLLIIFAAVWVGRTLAREITVPIQKLAEGTKEISRGNLDYKVEVRAGDEVGILVQSFNRMTVELKQSKEELEAAAETLRQANRELDEHGRYMATVLESITTGVLSLDPRGRVTTINGAARSLLGLDPRQPPAGRPFTEVLAGERLAGVRRLLERAAGRGESSLKREVTLGREGETLTLALTLSALTDPDGAYRGLVAVIDDLTQVARAQRLAAWQEVAQRIAHEIKNPLTPIQLSAERMRRKVPAGEEYGRLVEECTGAIRQEVQALKRLVDEFARYGRMPLIRRRNVHIHEVIDSALALYEGIHDGVVFERSYSPEVPACDLDPEQLRRALMNLVDNALQATEGRGRIGVATEFLPTAARIRVTIADDGPGIPPEARDKLFLPHFSTRERGTGLGLAIVHGIVTDHGGTIRVEENRPRGTRMILDLPVQATEGKGEAARGASGGSVE